MTPTAVTPTGVRDGDPDALAGLCAARGDAVLAYCEKVAGQAASATAAAEAFGRFRAAVVATADLAALNPEEVLVKATRRAAAHHAAGQAAGVCGEVPLLLAARADRSITISDLERLDSHLESCWACRAPVARFKAAERAYRDPPGKSVPPEIASAIIAALAAAAPVRGQEPEPVPSRASNGGQSPSTERMATIGSFEEPSAHEHVTAELRALEDYPGRRSRRDDALSPRNGNRRARRSVVGSVLARLGARSDAGKTPTASARASVSESGDVARSRRPGGSASESGDLARSRRQRASVSESGGVAGTRRARPSRELEPRVVAGTRLPRPSRDLQPALHGSRAAAVARRSTVLLPITLIVAALIVALIVAGVFSSGEPAASPQGSAPQLDQQSTGTTPKIVVVPGAKDASAAAVELAKKRARAKRRRDAEVARQAAPTQVTPAPTPAPAPAPVPPPAAGTAPPPPPPPPPAAGNAGNPAPSQSTGGRRVGTGNGATGSDQLPGQDSSTVPELAPPDDTTLPPG